MVYVSGGQVLESRSPWRFSVIPEFFWGIINFIVLFFKTMINPDLNSRGNTNSHTTDYRPPGSGPGGPPRPPRRRHGGFGGGPGAPSPPPMGGG
ncbi:selenoprotein K-like [Babylonia areolata]|uniref:selenoprotein K-like n=1 Tax=Babylonia areolata TaxID=304850 RepID=UPI003FD100EC